MLERFEEGDGGGSPLVLLPNVVAAGGPLGLIDMKLRLHIGVVHVFDESGVIGVAVGFIIVDVLFAVSFGVEESGVFVSSAVLGIFGVDLVVADSDGVVGVDSVGDLGRSSHTSSANLRPIRQVGFLSSEESHLQVLTRFLISGPK